MERCLPSTFVLIQIIATPGIDEAKHIPIIAKRKKCGQCDGCLAALLWQVYIRQRYAAFWLGLSQLCYFILFCTSCQYPLLFLLPIPIILLIFQKTFTYTVTINLFNACYTEALEKVQYNLGGNCLAARENKPVVMEKTRSDAADEG